MAYATLDEIEARYPGELAQAGPRDAANALDEDAIDRALSAASGRVDRALRTAGGTVPLAEPVPEWAVDLTVDVALYLATPTVLASQTDFADRRKRYLDALATLAAIASGELIVSAPVAPGPVVLYFSTRPRVFGRGSGLL